MYESDDDLSRLQELLDRTLARANPHLTSIVSPERRLSARQGRPLSPGNEARRVRDRKRARRAAGRAARRSVHPWTVHGVDVVGIAVNGRATLLEEGDPGVDELDRVWTEIYGSSPFSWGKGVTFMVIEPTSMWAYAFHPENFPE